MLRQFILGLVVLGFVGAAAACDCGAGGECSCDGACACGGDAVPTLSVGALDITGPQTVDINVSNFSFSANAVIHAGDTVRWNWIGGFHSVTSVAASAESFDSGLKSSGTFSHEFTQPGTYWYYCVIHGFDNGDGTGGGMAAMVTVLPVPEPGVAGVGLGVVAMMGMAGRRRRGVGRRRCLAVVG